MKLIEKIAYISFWINILFVIFVFIGLPVLLINVPSFMKLWNSNTERHTLDIILIVLNLAVIFHWGYCVWFLFKYDRYSKSIIPLFFFNALYAPVYYYRVKINKRPLRNKINKPKEEIATEDKSISDYEFIESTRQNVFGVIDLWASKDSQLNYQENVPKAQVSAELFCKWEEFYFPDLDDFKQAFDDEELEVLAEFDRALMDTAHRTSQDLPVIKEFVETEEWMKMNTKAIEIKKKIKAFDNI